MEETKSKSEDNAMLKSMSVNCFWFPSAPKVESNVADVGQNEEIWDQSGWLSESSIEVSELCEEWCMRLNGSEGSTPSSAEGI